MSKYETLVNILDEIRKEAPVEYKKYYPKIDEQEKLNHARSRSYIHLFLKVKFGLLDFVEREKYISDGSQDGGVDGYFIDEENKQIFFIQSKFRIYKDNFENKNIDLEEILAMELDRITQGENSDSNGVKYNSKIQTLIKKIQDIGDYAKYKEVVILLANLRDKHKNKLKKLTIFPAEIYNFERCYEELVFPVVSGTFYNPKELKITIEVNNNYGSNRIDYNVETEVKECNITVLFVPTREIANILYRYKNSILKFNPRSFLELAAGSVNKSIQKSITEIESNDFALFNNGITMLSDNTFYSDRVGKRGEASLIVTNPQIINGGQTAFTLSRIYEDILNQKLPEDIFRGKEVLLKVITFDNENIEESKTDDNKLKLIEAISRATNNQTEVSEADRRSNDQVQIELQRNIFNDFGYFYIRKKGEFGDGIRNKYINKSKLIDRNLFMRIIISVGGEPSQARRVSEKRMFKIETFTKFLSQPDLYRKYFYCFLSYLYLNKIQKQFDKDKNNQYGMAQYGNALRYGKLAVINVVSRYFKNSTDLNEMKEHVSKNTQQILNKWNSFEDYAKKLSMNKAYFIEMINPDTGDKTVEINFDNYYKGRTLSNDLDNYFNDI